MPFVTVGERKVYTEKHGDGAQAILFLHGAGSNASIWWQQLPTFQRHFTCITMDLRCFGRSHAPIEEYRLGTLADDAIAVLDHWGVGKSVVIGQSLGGMVGLRLALNHASRVSAFVACDSPLGIVNADIARALETRVGNLQSIEERSLGAWFLQRSPELAKLYVLLNSFNPSNITFSREVWDKGMQDLLAPSELIAMDRLKSLHCPTLWLVGSEDPLVPVKAMVDIAAIAPGAEVVVVADTGHSTFFEKPEAFNDHVLSFIRRRVRMS